MAEVKTQGKSQVANGPPVTVTRKPRRPSNIDPHETKAARFKRLVNFRVPKAIKAIRSIGLLGNSQQYEFTPEQVAIVIGLLTDEVKAAGRRFESKTGAKEVAAIL